MQQCDDLDDSFASASGGGSSHLHELELLFGGGGDNRNGSVHSTLFNFSLGEAYDILYETQSEDRILTPGVEAALIVTYSLMMGIGLVTNLVFGFIVVHKAHMRTPRNFYIVNLAASDVTLCIICMPFTLIKLLRKKWTLGSVLCKLVPIFQGTNILVSVGTITAIALDRYFTIVRHAGEVQNRRRVLWCLAFIWLFSSLATLPIFFSQRVQQVTLQEIVLYESCIEKWPSHAVKVAYTVYILVLQYIVPIAVLAMVHARIASHLNRHALTQRDARRTRNELKRNQKTTLLLSLVAVVFAVSWLPMNVLTILADLGLCFTSAESLFSISAVCHIIAMTTACTNPILYGWLNTNFRREFLQMLPASIQRWRPCIALMASIPTTQRMNDEASQSHVPSHAPFRTATTSCVNGHECENNTAAIAEENTFLLVPRGANGNKAVSPSTATSTVSSTVSQAPLQRNSMDADAVVSPANGDSAVV